MSKLERDDLELMRPHIGSFIRIHGVDEALRPLAANVDMAKAEVDEAQEPVDVNGMTGVSMGYDEREKMCLVQTFESGCFRLPATHLQDYDPPPAEEGGFDACWPMDDTTANMFQLSFHQCLMEKGYSVVQMVTMPQTRKITVEESKKLLHQTKQFYAEDEQVKLGKGNTTRVMELQSPDDDAEKHQDSEHPYLDHINRHLSYTACVLGDVCEMNGVNIWGRTDSWLRVPHDSAPDASLPPSNDPEFYKEFLKWVISTKLCMLYVVECEGGQLTLFPRGDEDERAIPIMSQPSSDTPSSGEPTSHEQNSDRVTGDESKSDEPSSDQPSSGEPIGERPSFHSDAINIPLRKGQLIVFHSDKLDYSYQPKGSSLAMQSWLLSETPTMKIAELSKPPNMELPMIHLCSVMERLPGGCYGAEKTWLMFLACSDLLIPVPKIRMDFDPYYEPHPDAPLRGKAYINHGSFVNHDTCFSFDHEFWGYTYEEAGRLGVNQRWVLETGYTVMYKAGYHKQDMNGQRIGLSIGDYFEEWMSVADRHKYSLVDDRMSYTCQALPYHLGWRGPTIHADTACSASLIALNSMANLMRRGEYGTQETTKSACSMGVLSMLIPIPWVGDCAGTMLSYKGRCFTFDSSADGFIRGEGCCAVNLQVGDPWEEARFDEKGRLGVVRGTASNQDGRSASLTAPSGPSQQECIRISLRIAKIDPKEVVVGECHGTGTALGDPIEVGSNRAVFGVKLREFNHSLSSAKSHIGHTETNAGVCGMIKSLLMCIHGCSTPDPHIHNLNSHLDLSGYDCMLPNEIMDFGRIVNQTGVSSFGFGGANARADIWARVMRGPRAGGQETDLDASEALSFVKYALKEGQLPQASKPKLSAQFSLSAKQS